MPNISNLEDSLMQEATDETLQMVGLLRDSMWGEVVKFLDANDQDDCSAKKRSLTTVHVDRWMLSCFQAAYFSINQRLQVRYPGNQQHF